MDDINVTNELRRHIGKNIRLKRESLYLTTERLSEMLDISPGFLSLIERGNRSLSLPKLVKASFILRCSMDELTKEEGYFLKPDAESDSHMECLITHIRANDSTNDEDVNFLIYVMSYMNVYKKAKSLS